MKTKIAPVLAVLLCLLTATTNAQKSESIMAPLPTDKILGTISVQYFGGYTLYYKTDVVGTSSDGTKKYYKAGTTENHEFFTSGSDAELHAEVEAAKRYPMYDPDKGELSIRNLSWTKSTRKNTSRSNDLYDQFDYVLEVTATVVQPKGASSSSSSSGSRNSDPLSKALNKALQDIRDGSRIAIDQVRVPSDMDRNEYKDRVVELLLDKGFKVVAKEYLERLYEEQKDQQSGKYNDRTVAQMGNFTGVGYYLNVRLTEETLRIQVINVSTGEYEGNVTVNL